MIWAGQEWERGGSSGPWVGDKLTSVPPRQSVPPGGAAGLVLGSASGL